MSAKAGDQGWDSGQRERPPEFSFSDRARLHEDRLGQVLRARTGKGGQPFSVRVLRNFPEPVVRPGLREAGLTHYSELRSRGEDLLAVLPLSTESEPTLAQFTEFCAQRGVLSPALALRLAVCVAERAREASRLMLDSRPVHHGCILPELVQVEAGGAVSLLGYEFGDALAKQLAHGPTKALTHFVAPEVLFDSGGSIQADIYSVGIALVELLLGPLDENSNPLQQVEASSIRNPGFLGPGLEKLLRKSLSPAPSRSGDWDEWLKLAEPALATLEKQSGVQSVSMLLENYRSYKQPLDEASSDPLITQKLDEDRSRWEDEAIQSLNTQPLPVENLNPELPWGNETPPSKSSRYGAVAIGLGVLALVLVGLLLLGRPAPDPETRFDAAPAEPRREAPKASPEEGPSREEIEVTTAGVPSDDIPLDYLAEPETEAPAQVEVQAAAPTSMVLDSAGTGSTAASSTEPSKEESLPPSRRTVEVPSASTRRTAPPGVSRRESTTAATARVTEERPAKRPATLRSEGPLAEEPDTIQEVTPREQPVPQPSPPAAEPAPRVEVPRILVRPEPNYPPLARRVGAEAVVVVAVTVLPDGTVSNEKVVSGPDKDLGFRKAALSAASRTRFQPGTLNGEPQTMEHVFAISFELTD